jgi:hypothetical protein
MPQHRSRRRGGADDPPPEQAAPVGQGDRRPQRDPAAPAGPQNRYEIRISPEGAVTFVDLPEGLAQVARVVAGLPPSGSTARPTDEGDDR